MSAIKEDFIKKNSVLILAGMCSNGEWLSFDLSVRINMVKQSVEYAELLYEELKFKDYGE